jgi:hypothetical protein
LVVAGVLAPLFACSSSETSGTGGYGTAGAAGKAVVDGGGGAADAGTAGKAGSSTGGTAGSTGGTGGSTGGTGGSTGGTGGSTGGTGGSTGGTGGSTGGTGGATGGTGGSTGGTGGSANCLPANGSQSACQTCIQSKCATEATACSNDAACKALSECDSKCTDSACSANCLKANPTGQDKLDAYNGCTFSQCWTDCFKAPGGCPFGTAGACTNCINGSCCTQCTTLIQSKPGMSAIMCIQWCAQGDAACQNACIAKYSGAEAPIMGLFGTGQCVDTSCGTKCQ